VRYVADLHIHSYLSRATSKDLNLEQLYRWAQLKGITLVGTGDFTHPRWFAELREKLVPTDGGLFMLREDLARAIDADLPPACRAPVRFMLSVEISSIYKRADKVRKVHNLVYVPDLESAAKIATRLATIGNIESDGRPILGLDSRNLLELVLESTTDGFLIPAHIWTPWFSVLGAQSGFDAVEACFADLTSHIFALETGLSSDPAMNWRLSALDRFALVSNSDAHSPEKLGREASVFDCDLSFFGLRDALRSDRHGFIGTVEFFPEEGKYHFDGHRKCGVVLTPDEARAAAGMCPRCGKRLTEGVCGRVAQLADRPTGFRPDDAKPYQSLVPLTEVLGEILDVGPSAGRVRQAYDRLLGRVGAELHILAHAPLEDIAREGPPLLSEAVRRIRSGEVHLQPGYDGEYGVVRAFGDDERRRLAAQRSFAIDFEARLSRDPIPLPLPFAAAMLEETLPEIDAQGGSVGAGGPAGVGPHSGLAPVGAGAEPPQGALSAAQRRAVAHEEGPLLIVAGPGTGKTRTVVARIGRLIRDGVSARAITAITFTRKAAQELAERLAADQGHRETTSLPAALTFHALGLELLRAFPAAAGLPSDFAVLDEAARCRTVEAATVDVGLAARNAAEFAQAISAAKSRLASPEDMVADGRAVHAAYERALAAQKAVDFDDLVARTMTLLETCEEALLFAHERCRYLFVDEYQDINLAQYRLVRKLAPDHANLCVVGDPDQAIYGFRGSDPSYFERFATDYPDATVVTLTENYRSTASITRAATQVIERAPGRAPRPLEARSLACPPIERFCAPDDWEEAETIAELIARAVGGTSLLSIDRGAEPLAFHDIAVLFRMARQGDAIAEALRRANLPFSRTGHEMLTSRPHLAAMSGQLERILHSPGPATLDAEVHRDVGQKPVTDLIMRLGAHGPGDPAFRSAVELLATLAHPYGTDVRAFLDALPLLHETDLDLEPQKVALLTLHAAKGLEFPLVIVAGCEDGLVPLKIPGLSTNFDEERRLLYVGMTRAKTRLVLASARSRTLFGRKIASEGCPFLAHVAGDLFQETPLRDRRRPPRQLSLL
jgi:DNA helicase-2/ATP-dependent DNA helicase PcrA